MLYSLREDCRKKRLSYSMRYRANRDIPFSLKIINAGGKEIFKSTGMRESHVISDALEKIKQMPVVPEPGEVIDE